MEWELVIFPSGLDQMLAQPDINTNNHDINISYIYIYIYICVCVCVCEYYPSLMIMTISTDHVNTKSSKNIIKDRKLVFILS